MNIYLRSIAFVILLAGVLFGAGFLLEHTGTSIKGEAYCADDAFRCSDGGYVGRIPPRCEFASCEGRQQENQEYVISVDAPRASARVTQPFQVRGVARVPKNIIQYELRDDRGRLISSGYVYTGAEEEGVSGPFVMRVESSLPSGSLATLSLFGRDVLHQKIAALEMLLTLD